VGPVSDSELLSTFPDTQIDHDNKEFYRGWLQRKLLLNRCDSCGTWHHPPKPVCPKCWSFHVTPTEVSGKGNIFLLIGLYQGPLAPDVDYSKKYPVAAVQLIEQPGLRYASTVINIAAEDLRIGMPVELRWIQRYGVPFPVFQPTSG
jgi:uncharacterized OB-fold protein